MAKKVVYLDEESGQRWRKIFEETGRNASGWIQEKLKEEEDQNNDPYFLQKKVQELKNKIDDLQIDLQQTQDRLKKCTIITRVTANSIGPSIDYALLKNMTKGIMQTYDMEQLKAGKLAREYLELLDNLPVESKMTLQQFIQKKQKEEINDL